MIKSFQSQTRAFELDNIYSIQMHQIYNKYNQIRRLNPDNSKQFNFNEYYSLREIQSKSHVLVYLFNRMLISDGFSL